MCAFRVLCSVHVRNPKMPAYTDSMMTARSSRSTPLCTHTRQVVDFAAMFTWGSLSVAML